MPSTTEFDQVKFKDLLLYVSQQLADDPTFGETKLNKVLFFSDFEAYRRLGRPITGAEYQKNLFGPTARMYPVLRDELLRWGQLRVERRLVGDHVQDVPAPHEILPNLDRFSGEELAIVDEFIAELRGVTNKQTSDLSHERSAGWIALELGQAIPYGSVLVLTEPLSEAQMNRALDRSRDEDWAGIRP